MKKLLLLFIAALLITCQKDDNNCFEVMFKGNCGAYDDETPYFLMVRRDNVNSAGLWCPNIKAEIDYLMGMDFGVQLRLIFLIFHF